MPASKKHAYTATRIATSILNGFEAAIEDHNRVTIGARARFEQGDWPAVSAAQKKRGDVYRAGIDRTIQKLKNLANEQLTHLELWRSVKREYDRMTFEHDNRNITHTFYNSVYSNWFSFEEMDESYLFVSSQTASQRDIDPRVFNRFIFSGDWDDLAINILDRYEFGVPWIDADQDADNIVQALQADFKKLNIKTAPTEIQILKSVFYRNKGAYLIGRILFSNQTIPLILPISHDLERGIFVDACITSVDDASVIFSFSRSHFMVDARIPQAYVNFLATIMPFKHRHELYTSLGFIKHGKTEFARDFFEHTKDCSDKIVFADGIPGMVMTVFTLPSFDVVFKVIKDSFTPPKKVSKQEVIDKYRLVNRHDKAGRMADTQEFKHFWIDKALFDPDVLQTLQQQAPSQFEIIGSRVRIAHVYIERRMIPLNIYVAEAAPDNLDLVMRDYGNAIKEIAGANIFPGDMLLKNFGVTRHSRVIFYDYDEIMFLNDCNFRRIPPPRNAADLYSDRPWYSVADNDVFPEEFGYFFAGNIEAKRAFERHHSNLYEVDTWTSLQQRVENGSTPYIYPFDDTRRFYPDRQHR